MTANLSQDQKDYFIDLAETSLNDLCSISVKSGSYKDSVGQVHYTRTTTDNIPCGISFSSLAYKNEVNEAVVITSDAILRLQKDQPIGVDDIVTCRNKSFTVDGIYEGLTLKIIALKSMVENE